MWCVVFVCGSGMIFNDGRHLASSECGGGNVRFEGRQFSSIATSYHQQPTTANNSQQQPTDSLELGVVLWLWFVVSILDIGSSSRVVK